MNDKSHIVADKILSELEKKIKAVYTKAYLEIKTEMSEVLNKLNITNTSLTPIERYNLSQKYDRLTKLEKQLADVIHNANKEAVKIINGDMGKVYINSYNLTADSFSNQTGINFASIDRAGISKIISGEISPFDKLALDNIKDYDGVIRKLTNELTTGIMKGEGIPQLAKRLKGVTEAKLSDAQRIARTETTRVENSGKQSVFKYGEKIGFKQVKRWVSTGDSETRDAHRKANGQTVPIDEPFIVDDEELMYPGDPNGSAGNVINCRCTVVSEILTSEEYDEFLNNYKNNR